jgi:hypothetical protein
MEDSRTVQRRLNRLAWLLDSAVQIPGLKFRVGLDALIGLIPGLGDAVGVMLSSYIVREAWQLGVPKSTLVRMGFNVAVEGIIGLIPFAGDVFDAVWKANQRNVTLLNAHLENPGRARAASRTFVIGLICALVLFISTISVVGFLVLRWVIQALSA